MKEFKVNVPDAVLDDLQQRLALTRWPETPDNAGWDYGANLDYMQRLVAYWRDGFDWRAAEAKINRFPQFTAPVALDETTNLNIHFIHERGSGDNPAPLLLLHGWPGSVAEFLDIIEPLAHPERFGGDAADGFDVIAPSLPGYGFSDPAKITIGPKIVGDMMDRLMHDVLGHARYFVQGGDWGSVIGGRMALDHADHVAAVHLNMLGLRPAPDDTPLTDAEKSWVAAAQKRRSQESAYQDIQATKSQSLAFGLSDSPVGLAAWITEKFQVWTVAGGEDPPFPMDELLTNIMIYWVTNSIHSSTRIYRGFRADKSSQMAPGQRVEIPMGFCLPPNDLTPPPPDSWLKKLGNVTHITRLEKGGHFTALEVGMPFADDIRAFFRAVRKN